jgi:hypothetical protein
VQVVCQTLFAIVSNAYVLPFGAARRRLAATSVAMAAGYRDGREVGRTLRVRRRIRRVATERRHTDDRDTSENPEDCDDNEKLDEAEAVVAPAGSANTLQDMPHLPLEANTARGVLVPLPPYRRSIAAHGRFL